MKEAIHPDYRPAKILCNCGNVIETRSTRGDFHIEICSNCHPFFTGKQKLMEKRIFPCMDIGKSGTRKEELLLPADWLSKIYILRQTILNGLDNVEAMKFILDKFRQVKNHDEFFKMMVGGGK